jgi:hypothetical protein
MRTQVAWRAVVVVVVLVAGALVGSAVLARTGTAAGGGDHRSMPVSVSVEEAVRRTLATGSARLTATVRSRPGAPAVDVTGVTSFGDGRSDVVARSPAGEVGVRVAEGRAWLRSGAGGAWTAIDPAATELSGTAEGWGDLLSALRRGPSGAAAGTLAVTHDGATGTIDLDGAGRIRRLRLDQGTGRRLDLQLDDFGTEVDVEVPPPP